MIGDAERWSAISESLVDNCGPRFGKKWSAVGKTPEQTVEMECRRLLGCSTKAEVKKHNGFLGTWADDVQPEVDSMLKIMSGSRNYGSTLKKIMAKVGKNQAVVPARAKRLRSAVSSDDEDDSTADLIRSLKEQNKLLRSRLNQVEGSENSLDSDDDDDDVVEVARTRKQRRTDDGRTPTGQAGILKNLLHDWSKEQVDPPPSDALGVANAATEKMAAKHAAPARPKKASAASASFANLMSGSDPSTLKGAPALLTQTERKAEIIDIMNSMSTPDFLELAGADSFIAELRNDKKKNAGMSTPTRNALLAGESFAKPNIQWKSGEMLYVYDFASESGNSIKDMVAKKLKRDTKDGYSLTVDGEKSFSLKAKQTNIDVKTLIERSLCVSRFISFAAHVGTVKNMITPLDLEQHRGYETRLLQLSQSFKFEFIKQYDVLFQGRLFDGPAVTDGLSSWADRPADLFQDVFVSQLGTKCQ